MADTADGESGASAAKPVGEVEGSDLAHAQALVPAMAARTARHLGRPLKLSCVIATHARDHQVGNYLLY